MVIANLIIGAFFILLGFVVKAYPDAIAGYNTMSAEKKKNVDVDGLSSMARNAMVLMGVLVAVGIPFFRLVKWSVNPVFFIMTVILSTVIGIIILSQQYNHNKRSVIEKISPYIIVAGIVLFAGLKMFKTREPLEISIIDNQITISGTYGLTEPVNNIELIEAIPEIKRRTGGYSDGVVRKGNFLLEEWGTCKLFLQSQGGPYIKISTSGNPIILNGNSADDTRKLYQKLLIQ
jgi:hypothetical protein